MAQYTGSQMMGSAEQNEEPETWDPKENYESLQKCYQLQVRRDEVSWEMSATARRGDAEVVLNLSCGVQATPHLMLTQVALFKALGIDFVATAGTKFCCGRPFGVTGDPELSNKVAKRSVARLATWNSTINVQCCGSCLVQFQHNVQEMREQTGTAPFEVIHITEFLLAKLRELGDAVPWVDPQPTRTRRVLLHAEGAEVHATKVVQRNAVIETLGLIPGLEYAGLVEEPSVGLPCRSDLRPGDKGDVGHTVLSDIKTAEYRAVQEELLEQARAVGAEAIVTHHHKCHREWSKFSSAQLPVVNYQSLLANALGVAIADRFRNLWQLDDVELILAETRPYWESWGIDDEEARQLVKRYFVPEYEASVQYCVCERAGGSCLTERLRDATGSDSMCRQLAI
jgi:hypothetical protein